MPPKLTKLTIENFRLLEQVEFDPVPGVSVLLGANNAGKSNVIDALSFLKDCSTRGVSGALDLRHGFERIVARHDPERHVRFVLTLDTGSLFSVEVRHPGSLTTRAPNDVGGTFHGGSPVVGAGGMSEYDELMSALVHVDPFRNINVQGNVEARTMIQPTGLDLPTVLHYHYTSARERFDEYEEAVKSVLTEIDIIETPILAPSQTTASVRFKDDPLRYDLWQVSSGVKDVLVLVAALHFTAPGSLVLIEEPENHLHPTAQRALAALMRKIAEAESKQIIITTHSEIILRQFDDDSVWYVDKKDGRATLTRFRDSELRDVWDRLGFEPEAFLEVLGNARQVLVIVEGRVDVGALEPLWQAYGVVESVITRQSRGGGTVEVAQHARALQDGFRRFGLPINVFVLFDNDGEKDAKLAALRNAGFDDTTSHVWQEEEIESYLAIPPALERISGRSSADVDKAIASAAGAGKERHARILEALGIQGTPANTIVQNALAADATDVPGELREIAHRVRRLLGLPDLA